MQYNSKNAATTLCAWLNIPTTHTPIIEVYLKEAYNHAILDAYTSKTIQPDAPQRTQSHQDEGSEPEMSHLQPERETPTAATGATPAPIFVDILGMFGIHKC